LPVMVFPEQDPSDFHPAPRHQEVRFDHCPTDLFKNRARRRRG
jgi:hypothetical protein